MVFFWTHTRIAMISTLIIPTYNSRFFLREAILQKIPEFYEKISQTGAGGSIGFHISYSEIVNDPKSVGKSE